MSTDIVFLSGRRTPFGAFGGTLKNFTATDLGVRTIGTLGILEAAAAKNLISLHDALTRLRSTNIYISEALIAQALDRHAQRDRT